MKKLIAVVSALLLTASFATPAQSAGAKYTVYQKTLATYSGSTTGLSSVQKAQVKATVEANPNAEKFICTGIRYFDQPMSVNIMVRKRAKRGLRICQRAKPRALNLVSKQANSSQKLRGQGAADRQESGGHRSRGQIDKDSLRIPLVRYGSKPATNKEVSKHGIQPHTQL